MASAPYVTAKQRKILEACPGIVSEISVRTGVNYEEVKYFLRCLHAMGLVEPITQARPRQRVGNMPLLWRAR